VASPALLSEIQNGLPELSEIPHELTRLGSVTAATPAKSDTRLVCNTVPELDEFADASALAAIGAREPAVTSANRASNRRGSRPQLEN
jgi:methylaspartate ammonia-lyase